MKLPRQLAAVLVLTFILAPPGASATEAHPEPAATDRPRVGLVLGGGGARGAAHIGVIRELERLRVPIDAIVGTSMGAIVGGLYASGITAGELEDLFRSTDWGVTMADQPSRDAMTFRRKEDDEQFPIKFELGVGDGKVRIPMGLIQGHRLELLLHELTIDVAEIENFNALPIPFRAVASDLGQAEMHVLAHGNLAHAMRASMSVPGIFAPTRLDDRLLGDGGLFANLPISVIRDMDVDVIIAVNAEFPLHEPAELDSALRISEQMLTILLHKETLRQIETLNDHDILIEPALGKLGSSDFGRIEDAIGPGAEAVVAIEDRLLELSLDESSYAAYRAGRSQKQPRPAEVLAFVDIQHDGALSDAALKARLYSRPGDAVSPSALAADADRIYGLGLYEQVNYHLVEKDGQAGVVFEAITKSWGKNDLKFGLSLSDDFEGDTAFNVTARLTQVGVNKRGAEWRTDLQLGSEPGLYSEFYQPMAAGSRWFVAPRLGLSSANLGVFEDNQELARLRLTEAKAAFDIGRELGYSGEFRFGVYRSTGRTRVRIGAPEFSETESDAGGMSAGLVVDTLDDAHFPEQGIRAAIHWQGSRPDFGADSRYDAYAFDFERNWTSGRSTTQVGLSFATHEGEEPAIQELFRLGGFRRLSGFASEELLGPHAALARVVYRRRLGRSIRGPLDVPAYFGASLEIGNVWEDRGEIDFSSALVHGSVFAGLDTYVGPLFIGAGLGEGGRRSYFLFVGAPPR